MKDGGPAFPVQLDHFDDLPDHPAPGMTLRQWYAGNMPLNPDDYPQTQRECADLLHIAPNEYSWTEHWPSVLAALRFRLADAMIAHEEEENG